MARERARRVTNRNNRRGVQRLQVYEKSIEKDGKNLGIAMKSLPCGSLSQ
jgi:hypothetical protein